jgi:molybdate transport system substrate-binding protein
MTRTALTRLVWPVGLVAAALALAGCGGGDEAGGSGDRTLTVYAASSLKGAFEQLGQDFEGDHHGVKVSFSFAGSSDLVAQIEQGAGADVFASADEANMAKLTADHLVDGPTPFATNVLEVAVPPDNPAGVTSLADLATPGTRLVTCAPEVPCGSAAARLEAAAGVHLEPVSEEQSVTDVLNKVISGEADAGLVYVTDVESAGDKVRGIEVPQARAVVNTYPIATVAESEQPGLARQFTDLVTGDQGQQVLARAGFGKP